MKNLDLKQEKALIDPFWISGFVDGEGCFYVGVAKNSSLPFCYQIKPEFTIFQHERDIKVIYALKDYF